MKADPKNFRSVRFAVAGFNVDRQAGVLRNLSMLEAGREAKGHGLYIDDETVKTGHECAVARKQLKGAIRHLSWDDYFSKGADRVLDFPGWFDGFSIKGEQLVAAKFEFYETFRTDEKNGGAASFARIMEMADKTPNVFGLSIEAWGYAVFVAEDGKEYGTKPDGVALKYDGVPALRITDLFFAAFVDEPAATSGLFAKFSAKFPTLSALFAGEQHPARTSLVAELKAFAAQLETAPAPGEVPVPAPSKEDNQNFSATMKLIAALKAKFTDNPTRLAAAMSILGLTPSDKLESLSVADVEHSLLEQDLAAANKRNEDQAAQLKAARENVTKFQKERDELQAKFEKFKKSGKLDPVDLGAGDTSGAAADQPNPWIKGAHFNRSKQAELQRKDPERAKQLKAAAEEANNAAKK